MTSTPDPADRRLVRVIESSVLFGMADRVLNRVWESSRSSTAIATAAHAVKAWHEAGSPLRRFGAGLALLVAAVVHLGLMLTGPLPPGWLWLVFPGLFASLGLLLIAASGVATGVAIPR